MKGKTPRLTAGKYRRIAAESLCLRLCLSSTQVHRHVERKGLDISKYCVTFFALPSSMTPPQNGRDAVRVGEQSQEKWTW